MLLIYLFIGLIAGFLGGLFGIGGGVIVVPALILLFEFATPSDLQSTSTATIVLLVVGTSMASIIFTAGSAAFTQYHKQNLDWRVVRDWVPLLAVGALTASCVAEFLPVSAIKVLIGLVLVGSSVLLMFNLFPNSNNKQPRKIQRFSISTVGGFISGLVGLGGGNIVVPTLIYFNYQMKTAVAVATVGALCIAFFATLGYVLTGLDLEVSNSIGYVYIPALIPIALTNLVAAPLGVQLGHKLPSVIFRRSFGVVMFVIALRMFYSVF